MPPPARALPPTVARRAVAGGPRGRDLRALLALPVTGSRASPLWCSKAAQARDSLVRYRKPIGNGGGLEGRASSAEVPVAPLRGAAAVRGGGDPPLWTAPGQPTEGARCQGTLPARSPDRRVAITERVFCRHPDQARERARAAIFSHHSNGPWQRGDAERPELELGLAFVLPQPLSVQCLVFGSTPALLWHGRGGRQEEALHFSHGC